MTEQDCKECRTAAVALKGICLLGSIVFITVPSTFIQVQDHGLNSLEKILFGLFLVTGLFLVFRSWHLYFDSQLLRNLANKKLSLSDVDQIVLRLFGKNIQGKTVGIRIKSCYKLAKGLFVLLALHLVCWIGLIVVLLF